MNQVLHLQEEEALEAANFRGHTPVGGIYDSILERNAASYFGGYMALKIDNFHKLKMKVDVNSCQGCDNIFIAQDLNLHLFVSFKQYKDNVDSS